MRSLTDTLTLCVVLALTMASCTPATPAAAPLATPQPAIPSATAIATNEPLSVAVPAVNNSNSASQLVVISTVTGKPFRGFEPIPLGQEFSYAFSPDGRTLATVSNAELHIVDLRSWKFRKFDIDLYGWLSAVVYSPDGALLALASGRPNSEIRIVDTKTGEIRAGAKTDFSVRHLRFTADEKAIMVYGTQVDGNGVSTGAPIATLFAVSDLSSLWSVELKNIRDGIFPKDPKATNIFQPGASWTYTPAIAFSPAADILYAVHGDEDRLTTIDFTARKVRTFTIHEKMSWLDHWLGAGVAHAKGMDGTNKQAAISPDGQFLYVVSTTASYTKKSANNWDVKVTHGGLQVIDVKDGSIVHHTDTEAETVTRSPDGRYLYLTGWKNVDYAAAWSEVYDTAANETLKHIDAIQLMPTYHVDGKPALVSIDYFSNNFCHLASLDPATWSLVSDWKGTCVGWLVDP